MKNNSLKICFIFKTTLLTELLEVIKSIKVSEILGKYLIIDLESTLSDIIDKTTKNALEFLSHVDKRCNTLSNICSSKSKIK